MLLWLTLALLWSTTCWAKRKSGWVCPPPRGATLTPALLACPPRVPHSPLPARPPGATLTPAPARSPEGHAHPSPQTDSSPGTAPAAWRTTSSSGQGYTPPQPVVLFSSPPGPLVHLEMYGEGGGKYFSTSSDCEITGIRVAVGLLGLVKR